MRFSSLLWPVKASQALGYFKEIDIMTQEDISEAEAKLIKRFEEANAAYEDACSALDDYFMPLMRAAVDRGDREAVDTLIASCPQSVTRAFLMDERRQAFPDRPRGR